MTIERRIEEVKRRIAEIGFYFGTVVHKGFKIQHVILIGRDDEGNRCFKGRLIEKMNIRTGVYTKEEDKPLGYFYPTIEDAVRDQYGQYPNEVDSQSGEIASDVVLMLAVLFVGLLLGSTITIQLFLKSGLLK